MQWDIKISFTVVATRKLLESLPGYTLSYVIPSKAALICSGVSTSTTTDLEFAPASVRITPCWVVSTKCSS